MLTVRSVCQQTSRKHGHTQNVLQKRTGIASLLLTNFRKDALALVKRHSPLERALFQKAVFEDITKKGSWLTNTLMYLRPNRSREYVNSLVIYEKIAAHAARPEWKGTSLKPGFYTWVRLCFLHLWLIEVRFRYLLDVLQRDRLTQPMYTWLWEDIELGLTDVLNTSNGMVIVKHSKRMVHEWFGTALSFDYGMVTGDTSLAEAIWRNVYNGDPDVPISEVNTLVKYVRQTQQAFMEETDETLINAEIDFLDPPFAMPDSEKVKLKADDGAFSPFRRGPDDSHLAHEMEQKLKELEKELEPQDKQKKRSKE